MQILQNISLKPYNTFGIDVLAKQFAKFATLEELDELFSYRGNLSKPLIIGGGSNILFTQNVDGLVAKNELRGIGVIKEDDNHVYVKSAAGENWHQFVLYCIENNFAGVENLSLIPGNVGASPMQNIGAYGVEIKDVFHELEAYHIADKKLVTFSAADCEFGYRESVFKRNLKGEFVIMNVTFKLNKTPSFNTSYGAIEQELERMVVRQISIKAISDAVINIRQSKLPNPDEIGNAGSFFKNPTIQTSQYQQLKANFPSLIAYPFNNQMKLAAGWLIENCGPGNNTSWKGCRIGDAGCHDRQALVLVNYGTANGTDIYALSTAIVNSVKQKFGVELEREVNII